MKTSLSERRRLVERQTESSGHEGFQFLRLPVVRDTDNWNLNSGILRRLHS